MDNKEENLRKAYEILPPDYLHYMPGEKNLTLLSEEELQYILEYCIYNGFDDEESMMRIIRKLEYGRLCAITTHRFLKGELDIIDFDEDGDIIWRNNNPEMEM